MDEDEINNEIHENCFNYGSLKQDYAKECFELSRTDDDLIVCSVERAWLGAVSAYIIQLENAIKYKSI